MPGLGHPSGGAELRFSPLGVGGFQAGPGRGEEDGALRGNGTGMGTRTGSGRAGNGPGPGTISSETDGGQFEDREFSSEVVYSGSDQDSDSGDDEDTAGSGGDRRGVKRVRSNREPGHQSAHSSSSGGLAGGYGGVSPGVPGVKPGKKTRGRVKIKMEFIDNKLRRYTTFSKRKTGIMKKVRHLTGRHLRSRGLTFTGTGAGPPTSV